MFHLLLRKWGMITKAVFKPYVFSPKLSQAHFLLPYNFRFSHSRCSSTLTSPSCPSPLAVHDRPICFSRQIGRKHIFSLLFSSYITEDKRDYVYQSWKKQALRNIFTVVLKSSFSRCSLMIQRYTFDLHQRPNQEVL